MGNTSGDDSDATPRRADESEDVTATSDAAQPQHRQSPGDADRTSTFDVQRAAADRDQAASDRDQAASDQDFVRGGDFELHEQTRALRDRGTGERRGTANLRWEAVGARDEIAQARALIAAARTQAAGLVHRELKAREAVAMAQARLAQLATAEIDVATDVRNPATGLRDLARELDRTDRTTGRMAVVYVDMLGGPPPVVDAAEWAMRQIRGRLRSYDLIVRVGEGRLLCAMPDATIDVARERFDTIRTTLSGEDRRCMIRARCVAVQPGETATELLRSPHG
ncbi:MAG TPA: hypothetical protein VIJ51_10895 [Solirubrobacteraceae bacterium]